MAEDRPTVVTNDNVSGGINALANAVNTGLAAVGQWAGGGPTIYDDSDEDEIQGQESGWFNPVSRVLEWDKVCLAVE